MKWRALLLPILLLPVAASAATIRVPADYPTIQEALDVSAAGDTVLVAPGTYADYTIVDGLPTMAALPEGVTLRSEGGSGVTTLDMSAMNVWSVGRGIVCHASTGNENVVEGLTIADAPADTYGFQLYPDARVVIRDCAVDPGEASYPFVNRQGIVSSAAELTVSGCSFRHCSRVGGGGTGGSAIRLGLGNVVIEDCEVRDCSDEAILHWRASSSPNTLTIRNTGFASIAGTAVRCSNVDGGVTVEGCRFDGAEGIHAVQLNGYGADVVSGCSFRGTWASCVSDHRGSLEMLGNTIADVHPTLGWGTVLYASNVAVLLEGNVITHVTGVQAFYPGGSTVITSGCNIYWSNETDLFIPIGPTDFVVDPLICVPDSGAPYVADNSPCLPGNHPGECPDRIGALGAACAGDGSVPFGVLATPLGPTVAVDGAEGLAPEVYSLEQGTHTLSADPVQELPTGVRYLFQSWSDGGAASHDIAVPASYEEISASFDTEYLLATPVDSGGSVAGGGWKVPGTVEVITAVPNPGYSFYLWLGSGDGSYIGFDNPATVTMNEPLTQHALFLPDQYALTTVATPGGTVTPSTGLFDRDSLVTIVAIPDSVHAFLEWTGEGQLSYSGPENPAVVRMDGPVTQTATFVDGFPILTMIAGEGGTVTPETGPQPAFSFQEVEAIPDSGYVFVSWNGEGAGSYTGTINPAGVQMLGPITQTATFAPDGSPVFHPLETVAAEGGTVTPVSGDFPESTAVVIRATPDAQHVFREWKGQGPGSYTGTDNPATITMNGPITQLAEFDRVASEFTLSLSASDPHVHTGGPLGLGNVYLWLDCATAGGVSALDLHLDGTLEPVSFLPAPGVFHGGSPDHPELFLSSCATGPTLLGHFLILPPGEGSLCIDLAAPAPQMFAENCGVPPGRLEWPVDLKFTGVRTDGGVLCAMGRGCDDAELPAAAVGTPLPPPVPVSYEDRFEGGFPNPFTSTASLRFSIARAVQVRLTIYDVAGRLVRTLVDEERPAGAYDVAWAGRSAGGATSPAGIFFAKLEAGGLQETRKLVRLAPR